MYPVARDIKIWTQLDSWHHSLLFLHCQQQHRRHRHTAIHTRLMSRALGIYICVRVVLSSLSDLLGPRRASGCISFGKCDYVFTSDFVFDKISRFVLSAAGKRATPPCARYFSVWGKCSGALLHAPGSAFSANTMQHNEGVIVIARSFCCAFVVLLRQKMCCAICSSWCASRAAWIYFCCSLLNKASPCGTRKNITRNYYFWRTYLILYF